MAFRQELGRTGETLAAEFLRNKGYDELARNYRLRQGEIDLLMRDGEAVVVVEVKTQTSGAVMDPIYKISPAKQRKLLLLASIIAAKYPERNIRLDAVTLYWNPAGEPVLTHYENIL